MLERKKRELTLHSYSTSSLNTLPSTPVPRKPGQLADTPARVFEYEDIIHRKKSPQPHYKLTDILARESDVTISNKVTPHTEYKGYGMYLLVTLAHFVWILWTLTPKSILNAVGIYYYPSRWWSLSLSSVVLMGMLYTYVALQLWNMEVETIKMDDLRAIADDEGAIEEDIEKYGWTDTNGVYDLKITDVNKVLYGD